LKEVADDVPEIGRCLLIDGEMYIRGGTVFNQLAA
jgi:hypothetical protein